MSPVVMPFVASSMALRARLGALHALDCDTQAICRRLAIDPGALENPDHFAPESTIWAMWRAASDQTGGPALGLRAGASVPFGAYGVLDYLTLTATTLGEGLRLLVRFWPLVGTGKRVEIVSGTDGCWRLRHVPSAPFAGASLQCRDYTMAVIATHVFSRSGLRPAAVELAGSRLGPEALYTDVLGARTRFDQQYTALVFTEREWFAPLPCGDPPLLRTLEEHAANLVERLPRSAGMVERVAREIAGRLSGGAPVLGSVARSLGVSERSLQRHLSTEGYRFEGLMDLVRQDAAVQLLKDPGLSISEVSYLLGYSGPAAFHRAFRRWTGTTPRQVRPPRAPGSVRDDRARDEAQARGGLASA